MGAMRNILILLFAGSLFAQSGLPTNANRLAFYGEVKTVRDSVVALQKKYYDANKKYFQGLPSDIKIRDISATLKQFDRSTKPLDQSVTWSDFGLRDISVRGTYKVDVYNGPGGWGYVLSVSIAYGEDVYTLSRNVGPETWRDTNLAFIKQTLKLNK